MYTFTIYFWLPEAQFRWQAPKSQFKLKLGTGFCPEIKWLWVYFYYYLHCLSWSKEKRREKTIMAFTIRNFFSFVVFFALSNSLLHISWFPLVLPYPVSKHPQNSKHFESCQLNAFLFWIWILSYTSELKKRTREIEKDCM